MADDSLYDRLQRNLDALADIQARIRAGDLPGLGRIDDIVAVGEAIDAQPVEVTWAARADLAAYVDRLDTLIAAVAAYEATVLDHMPPS